MLAFPRLARLVLHRLPDFVEEQAHTTFGRVRVLLQAEDFELVEVVLLPIVVGIVAWLILYERQKLLPPGLSLGAGTRHQRLLLPSSKL